MEIKNDFSVNQKEKNYRKWILYDNKDKHGQTEENVDNVLLFINIIKKSLSEVDYISKIIIFNKIFFFIKKFN